MQLMSCDSLIEIHGIASCYYWTMVQCKGKTTQLHLLHRVPLKSNPIILPWPINNYIKQCIKPRSCSQIVSRTHHGLLINLIMTLGTTNWHLFSLLRIVLLIKPNPETQLHSLDCRTWPREILHHCFSMAFVHVWKSALNRQGKLICTTYGIAWRHDGVTYIRAV